MKTFLPLLILLLPGCSPSLTRGPAIVEAMDASMKAIAAVYEAEQQACVGTPAENDCINRVRDRWAIARASLLATQVAVHAAEGSK